MTAFAFVFPGQGSQSVGMLNGWGDHPTVREAIRSLSNDDVKVVTLATDVLHVPRIAYVSCNPASFARDAKILVAGGYRLDWVQPVGQFRWSTHVELVGTFSR